MEKTNPNSFLKPDDLDFLWNPLDPASSEAAFRNLLPRMQEQTTSKEQHGLAVELRALIARAEAAQGRIPEARTSFKMAEDILKETGESAPTSARIRWLLERGRLYILEKTPSQALGLLSEAWTLAMDSGEDYFVVDIAQTMAIIENPKAQQKWILRAIEIAEKSPTPKTRNWLGSLYTTLGWKFFDLREFDKSLEIFRKALSHLKTQGSNREVFVARWSIGKVLRAQGKTEEALVIQNALVAELGIGGARDGRLYEELAECLQTLRRSSEAQLYFELAYRELSSDEWITDNQPLKLKRMKDLGKVKL